MSDSVPREEIERFLNELLRPEEFDDYGPNGLQVEGKESIKKIAFAVSATRYSIGEAIKYKADGLVVHHGLFWNMHGVRTLTGPFGKRVLPLVLAKINLFAYHLPLDAHPVVGNAAGIAALLKLKDQAPFGECKGSLVGIKGCFANPPRAKELQVQLEKLLDHRVMMATPNEDQPLKSIGIITGGANSDWIQAFNEGLCAYLTGEMSEHDWHESQEGGVHMFAGGHNATERFGVLQLQEVFKKEFQKIETIFIPSDNPA